MGWDGVERLRLVFGGGVIAWRGLCGVVYAFGGGWQCMLGGKRSGAAAKGVVGPDGFIVPTPAPACAAPCRAVLCSSNQLRV